MRDWFNTFYRTQDLRETQARLQKEYLDQLVIRQREGSQENMSVKEEAERGLIIEGEVVK